MDVKLTTPGSVPGKFALVYADTDIQVFADAGCTEPIMSGTPAITPSGCTTVYVKGLADSGGDEIPISLYYCPIASRGVDAGGAGTSTCAIASPLAAPAAAPLAQPAAPGPVPLARAGETVTTPVEILYAVDGTTDKWTDNTVVWQFYTHFYNRTPANFQGQRFRWYWDGPKLDGSDGPKIFQKRGTMRTRRL